MKKILAFIILSILVSSCEDFLQEDPRGNLSAEQYFNSKEECINGINGVISGFTHIWITSSLINTLNMGTDQVFMPWPVPAAGMLHGYYNAPATDSRILGYWELLYAGVRDVNMVISRIEKSSIDDPVKATLLGEAKFWRAFIYYYLVTLWGDVPFWVDELDIDHVSKLGKTDANDILEFLLADLDEADLVLPSTTFGNNGGRATKWAAKMLKARIHLWQKNWEGAKLESSDIIQESPHGLLANFGDIFRASNEKNAEIIFAVEFQKDMISSIIPNQYRPAARFENHILPAPGWFDGLGCWCFYQSFVDTYEADDVRRKYTVLDYINGVKTNYNWCLKYMELPYPEDDPLIDAYSPSLNTGRDDIYMRLGDTYLVLAEAENELNGPTITAFDAVNEIRNRAGLEDLPSDLSKDGLRQAIRAEISKELAGEHIGRKRDLIRWGILIETVKSVPALEAIAQLNPDLRTTYKTKAMTEANRAAGFVSEKWNFFPIPGSELDRNPSLVQNPLWITGN